MFFPKTVVVISLALSALAVPHIGRASHHGLARRAPSAEPEPTFVQPSKRLSRKRANGRCKTKDTSSAVPSSHVSFTTPTSSTPSTTATHSSVIPIVPPKNVESAPPSLTAAASPATSSASSSSSSVAPTTPPVTPTKHTASPSKSSSSPPPASSSSSGVDNNPDDILGGPHSGDGTFYSTGLGSCGIVNNDNDHIVAVSHILYDKFPGYNGLNPNNNPVCKRMIKASWQGQSVEVMVTDRCTGCQEFDLDFSPTAFNILADPALGRIHDVTWEWA